MDLNDVDMKIINEIDGTGSKDSYFKSYEDLDIHQLMLKDEPRTLAYKNAIFNMKDQFKDKIVMDIGAGTGILSIFCAQAGARKVYSIEASNLAEIAREVVKENNFHETIEVIEKRVEDIDLNTIGKVDIIVSEWMGFYLLHEGMLDSVIIARDRFLKEYGLMFPDVAKFYVAPCELPNVFNFWDNVHGVHMKTVKPLHRKVKCLKTQILSITEKDLLTNEHMLLWLDLKTLTREELNSLGGEEIVLVCSRDGNCDGISTWFEVDFPDNSTLSTSPAAKLTHWKQSVIVLPEDVTVSEKEPFAFTLTLNRNATDNRRYDIVFAELDPEKVDHEVPCDCHMTKCIVTRTYIENQDVK